MRCPRCKTGELRTASPLEVREGYHWCYSCHAEYQLPEMHDGLLLERMLDLLVERKLIEEAVLYGILDQAVEDIALSPIPRPTGLEDWIDLRSRQSQAPSTSAKSDR
jgi:hypothetical protein